MATNLVLAVLSSANGRGPARSGPNIQSEKSKARRTGIYGGVAIIMLGASTLASAGEWEVLPSIKIAETLTDNVALAQSNKHSDAITEISPGIRLRGTGDRLKLDFDYQLQRQLYARDSSRAATKHALNTLALLELLDDWMFVEARGAIAQQEISAFGGTPLGNTNNSNRTETANYRISPYIRGDLARVATYQLRYNRSTTQSKSEQVADVNSGDWSAGLTSLQSVGGLGWSLDGGGQKVKFENGRRSESEHVRALLSYQPSSQFRLAVFGGRERNDHASIEKQSTDTPGASVNWNPTERTNLAAQWQRRFFGNSTNFSLNHRTALSAWRISSGKDISISPNQFATVGLGSYYDLYFSVFESIEPDPVKRATLVNNFLLLNGIPPNTTVTAGFLASRIAIQRRHDFSFGLLGASNSVTFSASQTDSRALSMAIGLPDDFSTTENIRQQSASLHWAHQFSPLSSLTAMLMRTRSLGDTAAQETTTDGFSLLFSKQLSPLTRASLGFRRTLVEGTTNYAESALTGTLSHQF